MTTQSTELLITVSPNTCGWTVLGATTPSLEFSSGAEAERAARHLAEDLLRAGYRMVVEIFLRDGRLAGRFRFGAEIRENDMADVRELEPA